MNLLVKVIVRKNRIIRLTHNICYPIRNVFLLIVIPFFLLSCATPVPIVELPTPSPIATLSPDPPKGIRLANGNWPPYNSNDLAHFGCDSQVIQEAFALEGIPVTYGFFPWARSYRLSVSGEWDGTLAWDDTPDHRIDHYISAKPTTVQEWVFFYRTDHPFTWKTLADLKGKTIGVTTGYVYSDAFIDLKDDGKISFIESSSDEANLKMLLAGRIDVFPMERRVGNFIIKSTFTPEEQAQFSNAPQAISEFRTFLLLSKAVPENEKRMVLFNTGFKKLQESGRYEEIMQNCSP